MTEAPIGILMLETRFPRLVGDIGNPATFPFPVIHEVVARATADRVVRPGPPDPALLAPFLAALDRLAARGAAAIATSCGFLSLYQETLAARSPVPVLTSSLLQIPLVQAMLPAGQRAGVLTVDAGRLSPAHLAAAGAPPDTPIAGTERGRELTRVVLEDRATLDPAAAEADVLEAGERLARDHPELGAVVLECTNMPPYAGALSRRLGLPVFDAVTLLTWFRTAAAPRSRADGWQTPRNSSAWRPNSGS